MEKTYKIVYFDETSITDYLIMHYGGIKEYVQTIIKSNKQNTHLGGELEVGMEIGNGHENKGVPRLSDITINNVLNSLAGINVSGKAKVEGDLSKKFDNEKITQYVLKNSILREFFDVAEENSEIIEKKENYSLNIGSGDYLYDDLLSTEEEIWDLPMKLNKKEMKSLKQRYEIVQTSFEIKNKLKGYWECCGIHNGDYSEQDEFPISIFRFNVTGFRNNYKVKDLDSMELILYVMKVGKKKIEDLRLFPNCIAKASPNNEYIVYDVLAATIGG